MATVVSKKESKKESENASEKRSKYVQRTIRFNKFRNIGIDEPQDLVLNSNFEKGNMGNLLVLIGSNNSGKSNVLDGILKLNDKKLADRDRTDLSFNDEDMNPSISLWYKNEKDNFGYVIDLKNGGKWKINQTSLSKAEQADSKEEQTEIILPSSTVIRELNSITDLLRKYPIATNLKLDRSLDKISKEISEDKNYKYENYADNIFSEIKSIEKDCNKDYDSVRIATDAYGRPYNKTISYNIWKEILDQKYEIISAYLSRINRDNDTLSRDKNTLEGAFSEVFGVSPIPVVHRYQEDFISGKDLYIDDISAISQSKFFKALFNSFDNFNVNSISTAYNRLNETHNSAILDKLEKEVKPRLKTINDRFNKLYFASNDKYKFTLKFESSRISFGMARGKDEDPIRLEYQSTGFRWFFDFYFNFIANNSLKPGDIVIMDEPATNLHPQGQAELRKFIKEFAVKNDILFIIATHSPFLIDTDNYDELRVVSMENNRSRIDNLFTVVNMGDPDSLLPIKESLTIKQNVFYDLDTEVVWVEGITDYVYLTMFKNFLGIKNMAFLPFNGVGTSKEETAEILKKLIGIKFHKRSLLVDADKAGKDMYGQAEKGKADFAAIHNLSEVEIAGNKKAKVIEDLFSSEDKKKYDMISEKRSLWISDMKNHAKKEDFSEETIANFTKLFELLQDN